MKLDKTDIEYAEMADQENMEGQFFNLYFNRMTPIDMEIVCEIYGRLIQPGGMMPANNWFNNLNT
jgi:hypothetical protein